MKLTWKDGAATILVGAAAAATLAVTKGWDWPLLGSYRWGVVMLAVVGVITCAVAGGAGEGIATKEPATFEGPLGALARLLHLAVPAILLIGLIAPSAGVVLAMGADVLALWVVGTIHHAVQGRTTAPDRHPVGIG
jgi:hypothetical protein